MNAVLQLAAVDSVVPAGEPWMGVVKAGSTLRIVDLETNRGRALMRIQQDDCGRHDTLGGACSAESNTVRYALEKRHMHSCRDSFLLALARHPLAQQAGMTKRDLPSNINFFMNVPVTPEGGLRFADGISAAGRAVELQALMDTLVLISNCPQLNNPCNAYNPTPVRVQIREGA
jgi:urea carboxylase-associated protein 1